MTTARENSLLDQIATDVGEIKVGMARVETKVQNIQDTSLDHEGRLRAVEKQADTHVTTQQVRWWFGAGIGVATILATAVQYFVSTH